MKHYIMKCEHCGAAIADNVKRCVYCGQTNSFTAVGMGNGLREGENGEMIVEGDAKLIVGTSEDLGETRDCPFCGAEIVLSQTVCEYCRNRVIIEHLEIETSLVIEPGAQLVVGPGGSMTIGGSITIGSENPAEENDSGILDAARSGSIGELRKCVNEGQDVNHKDNDGRRPLHLIVKKGSPESVRYLLAMGAGVNERDKKGNSALHYAARDNRVEIATILLRAGASKKMKNNSGKTALELAGDRQEMTALLQ